MNQDITDSLVRTSRPRFTGDIERIVTHEIGDDLTSDPISELVAVSPSNDVTFVKFTSQVVSHAASSKRSSAYMGAKRRDRAGKIHGQLLGLAEHAERDDFEMFVHPVVEAIRKAIRSSTEVETEGNPREILRLIRDSLLDGGWENYRRPEVRTAVCDLLDVLQSKEEVDAEDAHQAFDSLDEMELLPRPPLMPDVKEETQLSG